MLQDRPVRIVVVDDHPVVRSGLVSILNRHPGFQVVGEAEDGVDAVHQYERLRPDVVVMDLHLPILDGWQTLSRIRELDPKAKMLAISANAGDEDVHRAMECGAKGYLLKDAPKEEIIAAVNAVAEGRRTLSATAAERITERLSYQPLTPRELDILGFIALGESNKEIAARTGVSENTVKGHVTNLMSKLAVDDRTAAVTLALRRGLIRLAR